MATDSKDVREKFRKSVPQRLWLFLLIPFSRHALD
jgi:hypothetical protein